MIREIYMLYKKEYFNIVETALFQYEATETIINY